MKSRVHAVSEAILLCACCLGGLCGTAATVLAQRRAPRETTEPSSRIVTLGGWVKSEDGNSLPSGVAVRLETDEGMVGGEQPVAASGYFEFPGLAPAYYHLTVTAPGFQPYQQDVDLRSVGNRLNINVALSPGNRTRSLPDLAAHSFTDDNAPRHARKEYARGARALLAGNLAAAQPHLERAVEDYPCYARAQTDLAAVLSARHQPKQSEAALKQATACDPDYVDAYSELGQLYYNEGRYQESATALRQGLRRSPGSWQFHYQLGASDYRLRQYADAEQEYLRAESLSFAVPAEVHVKLADVYLRESRFEKAYDEMGSYVCAEPNGRFAAELKEVMGRMESDHTVRRAPPCRSR